MSHQLSSVPNSVSSQFVSMFSPSSNHSPTGAFYPIPDYSQSSPPPPPPPVPPHGSNKSDYQQMNDLLENGTLVKQDDEAHSTLRHPSLSSFNLGAHTDQKMHSKGNDAINVDPCMIIPMIGGSMSSNEDDDEDEDEEEEEAEEPEDEVIVKQEVSIDDYERFQIQSNKVNF